MSEHTREVIEKLRASRRVRHRRVAPLARRSLWFSNWGTGEIIAVDLDGNCEVAGRGPDGLGWATNWLRPDAVTGDELIRVEPDGSRVRHADLSHISPLGWSELTVDGHGNAYVNTVNFDFADFNAPTNALVRA